MEPGRPTTTRSSATTPRTIQSLLAGSRRDRVRTKAPEPILGQEEVRQVDRRQSARELQIAFEEKRRRPRPASGRGGRIGHGSPLWQGHHACHVRSRPTKQGHKGGHDDATHRGTNSSRAASIGPPTSVDNPSGDLGFGPTSRQGRCRRNPAVRSRLRDNRGRRNPGRPSWSTYQSPRWRGSLSGSTGERSDGSPPAVNRSTTTGARARRGRSPSSLGERVPVQSELGTIDLAPEPGSS